MSLRPVPDVQVRPRLLTALLVGCLLSGAPDPLRAQEQEAALRLIGVGDVMPGTEFPDPSYLDPRLAGGAGP